MKKLILMVGGVLLAGAAQAGGNVAAGKALTDKYQCFACHGKDYNTPIAPDYPKLAGQHKDYLEHALRAYKRNTGAYGRNNPIMVGQVQPLSNQDIQDLAAYFASLPGTLATHR